MYKALTHTVFMYMALTHTVFMYMALTHTVFMYMASIARHVPDTHVPGHASALRNVHQAQ